MTLRLRYGPLSVPPAEKKVRKAPQRQQRDRNAKLQRPEELKAAPPAAEELDRVRPTCRIRRMF
jgi:hypothetical protein